MNNYTSQFYLSPQAFKEINPSLKNEALISTKLSNDIVTLSPVERPIHNNIINYILENFITNAADNLTFAIIHTNQISLYAFTQGELMLANVYDINSVDDIAYYCLLVYDALQLNPEKVKLKIVSDQEDSNEIIKTLQQFIWNVEPVLVANPLNGWNAISFEIQTCVK